MLKVNRYITYKSYSKRFYKLKRIYQRIPLKRQAQAIYKIPELLFLRKLNGNFHFPMSFKQKIYQLYEKKVKRKVNKKAVAIIKSLYQHPKITESHIKTTNLISLEKKLKQIVAYSQFNRTDNYLFFY